MKRVICALGMALSLLIGSIGSAHAIGGGGTDGGQHPYVGLVVFDVLDAEGNQVASHRCSGALLSSTILLTAGRCTKGTVAARVWFEDDLTKNTEYVLGGGTSYDGVAYTFQDFCQECGQDAPPLTAGDIGLVVLHEAVPTRVVDRYAQLPAPGLVDRLQGDAELDLVGYGVHDDPAVWMGLRQRMIAPGKLIPGNFVHADQFLRLTLNANQDRRGLCFGDSGGPDLLHGTNTILGINTSVTNASCMGVGYSTRVDTPAVLEWIQSFLQSRKSQ